MSTQIIRRTSCGNCGKIVEHESNFPEGWGNVELRWKSNSGYVVSAKEISTVCPDCMRAAEKGLSDALMAVKP